MMNKEQKKQYIEDMTSQFDKTEAVIVTHYQGLTVNQLDDLRKKRRGCLCLKSLFRAVRLLIACD